MENIAQQASTFLRETTHLVSRNVQSSSTNSSIHQDLGTCVGLETLLTNALQTLEQEGHLRAGNFLKRRAARVDFWDPDTRFASQTVTFTTAGSTSATASSPTSPMHAPVPPLPCYTSTSKENDSQPTDFSHQYWCPGPDDDRQPCMCSGYRLITLPPLINYNQGNYNAAFQRPGVDYVTGDSSWNAPRELTAGQNWHLPPPQSTVYQSVPAHRAPTPPSIEQLRELDLHMRDTMEDVHGSLEEKAPVLTDQTGVIDLLVELVERQFVQVVKPAMVESGQDWDRWEQRYLLAQYYKGTNPAMGPRRHPTLQQVVVEGGVEYEGDILRDKEFPVMVIQDAHRVDWDRIAAEMQELCQVKDSRYTADRCRKMWVLWYQCQMDLRGGFEPLRLTPGQYQRHQDLGSTGSTELLPFPSVIERLRMDNARFREVGKWEEEEIKVLKEAVKDVREKASKWSYSRDQVGVSTRPGFGPVTWAEYYEQGLDWEEVSTQSLPWRMPKDCAMAAYNLLL
ncbi:hypothetical protein BGZ90_012020 [Linnemannia elongata]|nr:hypothetical protein BGZ90_012020 [Linnemannia elongata]